MLTSMEQANDASNLPTCATSTWRRVRLSRHGIPAGHAGHYRLRVVDAMQVDECLPYDVAFHCRTDCESVRERRETSLRFQACFGRAEYDRIQEPVNKARECVKVGASRRR